MGVKVEGGSLPGSFERRHVGLSFRRSAVLMTWCCFSDYLTVDFPDYFGRCSA